MIYQYMLTIYYRLFICPSEIPYHMDYTLYTKLVNSIVITEHAYVILKVLCVKHLL